AGHRWTGSPRFGPPSSSPFHFGPDLPDVKSLEHQWSRGNSAAERHLNESILGMVASVGEMQRAMRMTSIGVDFAEYHRFRSLTPSFFDTMNARRTFRAPARYAPEREHF